MKILITGGSGFIGTNLLENLLKHDIDHLNVDKTQPKISKHIHNWIDCNLLDYNKLYHIFEDYKPSYVLHLAARTDILGKTINDYRDNTNGTANLLKAIKLTNSIEKIIITSSQFVHQFHGNPQSDEEFFPYTIYGESKVITEKLTRQADLKCQWTIIRPTNVWGPWHSRYPKEFWKIISDGKYIHPDKKNVIRSYGYVYNVIDQIEKLFSLPEKMVNKNVFYLGDPPIYLIDWVNGFSKALIGRDARKVFPSIVYLLGLFGDLVSLAGINFPITRSRYKSMTSSNPAPMEKTINLLGNPKYNLNEAIEQTVIWLKEKYPELVKL